ncbi:MAG: efflux RND transporter permease subunit [Sphingomonas sp.]
MSFRNISAWSIRNPVPPIVLFVALTIAGLVSFMKMDVDNNPDIDFPIVWIDINQPGAAPVEMETQITQKVEAAVRSLQGIDQITSTVKEGDSTTVVQLAIGTPIDRAVEDVRSAIQQIRGNLPDGILEPQIGRVDTSSDNNLAGYSAVGTDMTLEQLSWYVDNDVSKALLAVPGMSSVQRNGGVTREIRIILDPAKLQSQGLTADQVNSALRQINLNAAGGQADINGSQQAVRVLGNAASPEALTHTRISVGGGRTIELGDIATVKDLYAEPTSASAINGKPVVSFEFTRAKNYSDVTVYHGAVEALQKLEKQNPKVHFELLENNTKYAEEQYKSAIDAMIEGAVLAVVVVFVFLRDWRATVISALAIPLSAIPTFWFLDLLGFSLNNMTLLALSLVAGVLVDDAIVEIENIVRHMRMGKSAYQAAIDAADEIGLAVLATTMSIVAVFLPVGLMPGITGQFFKCFGLTVVAAVLMSLGVARMITPMIAAYFLKSFGHASHGEGWLMDRYVGALRWTLRHRWVPIVAAVGALVLTGVVAMTIPMVFQPNQDRDTSTVNVTMVPGSTLEQTQVVVNKVAKILQAQKQVSMVYQRSFVGNGRVTATLIKDRGESSTEFERSLAPTLNKIPDAQVSFSSQQGWGSSGRDLTIVLGGEDPEKLRSTAIQLVDQMAKLPQVVAPRISGDLQRPEIQIRPHADLAASLGVTTAALSNAIRVATIGDIEQNSARYSLSDRQIPIIVSFSENAREKLSNIQNLPVATSTGGSVPLGLIADIGFGAGPTQIDRLNQERQLTVGADLAPNVVSGTAMTAIHNLPIMKHLPAGVSEQKVGSARWQQEMINNFVVAVISGVFLVFAVLVLLYRRFLPPFVNMGSLMLAPLGAILALKITGNPLSLPVFIGLLMLIGIVAKNSILLIDFALEEMNKGVDTVTAIVDAGHKRAQPIVMTTVAMVAGMIPSTIALTGDASFRGPMGITVIGGLIVSTLLTLLIVPAAFSLAVGAERWIGPRLGRRLLTYQPGDEGVPAIDQAKGPRPIGYHGDEDAPQPAE